MLDRDVVVFEFAGFVEGTGEEAVEASSDADLAHADAGAGDGGNFVQLGFEFGKGQVERHASALEEAGDETIFLLQEGIQEVFDIDARMAEAGGVGLGFEDRGLGAFGEFIEIHTLCPA
jgi:hypothetical protein